MTKIKSELVNEHLESLLSLEKFHVKQFFANQEDKDQRLVSKIVISEGRDDGGKHVNSLDDVESALTLAKMPFKKVEDGFEIEAENLDIAVRKQSSGEALLVKQAAETFLLGLKSYQVEYGYLGSRDNQRIQTVTIKKGRSSATDAVYYKRLLQHTQRQDKKRQNVDLEQCFKGEALVIPGELFVKWLEAEPLAVQKSNKKKRKKKKVESLDQSQPVDSKSEESTQSIDVKVENAQESESKSSTRSSENGSESSSKASSASEEESSSRRSRSSSRASSVIDEEQFEELSSTGSDGAEMSAL